MVSTLEEWMAAKTRPVTLSSGIEVVVALPGVLAMIKAGRIPNELMAVATRYEYGAIKPAALEGDELTEWGEFVRTLVAETLVSPRITAADVDKLPAEDFNQLWLWALRIEPLPPIKNTAAVNGGEPAGGDVEVETVRELAPFRGEPGSSPS